MTIPILYSESSSSGPSQSSLNTTNPDNDNSCLSIAIQKGTYSTRDPHLIIVDGYD